jgi:hypothetical protein
MSFHAGFDCSTFPGLNTIAWLKANTNLAWCGYYLAPAPSHQNTSWMGQRSTLQSAGWGLAPVFVGQQTTGPGSHTVTAAQGTQDGILAAQIMQGEGFVSQSWVYLDLENGPPYQSPLSDYTLAWATAVHKNGYSAGIYCSHGCAATIAQQLPNARIWAFKVTTTAPHPFPGTVFPDPDPAGSGYAQAAMWQLQQNCTIKLDSGMPNLIIDLDSSTLSDPASPEITSPNTAPA